MQTLLKILHVGLLAACALIVVTRCICGENGRTAVMVDREHLGYVINFNNRPEDVLGTFRLGD